jgi:hypothetical protein
MAQFEVFFVWMERPEAHSRKKNYFPKPAKPDLSWVI